MRVWLPLLGFVGVAAWSVWGRAPAMQADLQRRTTDRLSELGIENVGVWMDGRDARLTGVVDSAERERQLESIVASVWGIRAVHSDLTHIDPVLAVAPHAPRGTLPSLEPPTPAPALLTEPAQALEEQLAEALDQRGVEFQAGSAQLSRRGLDTVDHVAQLLRGAPGLVVEIGCHTDSSGSQRFNLDLSRQRAEAVALALVERDITRDRLVPLGFGSSLPRSTNRTEAGRAHNRRIEFRVIGETDG